MVTIQAGGATDRGRVRQRNEDAFFVGTRVFAVADGLGGHPAGDVASTTALQVLEELDAELADPATANESPDGVSSLQSALVAAVHRAHDRVRDAAAADAALAGMGTTLTSVAVEVADGGGEGALVVAHVGDSRCYLWRDGRLRQVTVDHTPVQQEVDAGRLDPEAARRHPARHILARALGLDEHIEVDTRGGGRLQPGDRWLLCSDGLTEMLSDPDIGAVLGADEDAPTLARRLVDAAVRAGGLDNVTTVVLRVQDA